MENNVSLNKYISSLGLCSRREADRWIDAGRITINGRKAKKGNRVSSSDKVAIHGDIVSREVDPIYIAFNKPIGITCTTDRKDKDNIVDYINHQHRIFPVGRLDKDSMGLIILTNDGDIVNRLLRAENKQQKEYIVQVNKPITEKFLSKMTKGVPILGTITKKCTIKKIDNVSFNITLIQGLNRQIRRMCEYLGYEVEGLKRVRIANIKLGKLKPGHHRDLTKDELETLIKGFKPIQNKDH